MSKQLDIFILGRFPGLNETNNNNRANKYAGAMAKRIHTQLVALQARKAEPIAGSHDWVFTWHTEDKRRDPDNIASAVKFVFDGLIAAGVIENDGWEQVRSIVHHFVVDPDNVGVGVVAVEVSRS